MIRVDVLYINDCPWHLDAWAELGHVITEQRLEVCAQLIHVATLQQANALQFAGSPTIKVDGHDLEDYEGPGVMACRVYQENGGKGVPSRALLRRRLLKAQQHQNA
jgi:hypothetical protein